MAILICFGPETHPNAAMPAKIIRILGIQGSASARECGECAASLWEYNAGNNHNNCSYILKDDIITTGNKPLIGNKNSRPAGKGRPPPPLHAATAALPAPPAHKFEFEFEVFRSHVFRNPEHVYQDPC